MTNPNDDVIAEFLANSGSVTMWVPELCHRP
jgi:hypothetical protein